MLFKNDVFKFRGARYRLLEVDARPNADSAWVINIDDRHAMPLHVPFSSIRDEAVEQALGASIEMSRSKHQDKCEAAWGLLSGLLSSVGSRLFDPLQRNAEIREHAEKVGCSKTTLYKQLRRYWQRGQTKFALIPDYENCGNSKAAQEKELITAKRGRPTREGQTPYQLKSSDVTNMKAVIEHAYLKDQRTSMVAAYKQLIRGHYRYEDGNRALHVLPNGEKPSFRQFQTYLRAHYNIEVVQRSRKGNSDFERENRKVLGTVLQDCLGVGHYYEIDATIVDIHAVSSEDRRKIVGKATLYLIIDRKSRLIVGFYLGLEHASWAGALQAILSISEDKEALCKRYGVEFKPEDWPAHQVFPQEFLADRGEMLSNASSQIADGLEVTVTNLPSKRPDWKPLVECEFHLLHCSISATTPAYDPPANATRRQGKKYSKDACLSTKEVGAILLNAAIHHNRREMLDYQLSNKELLDGIRPSPTELWNYGVISRAGRLSRYNEETVRYALLPNCDAVVSEHGIELNGCYYTCPIAIERKWFESARIKRFKVRVSFDKRLVDLAYVHYTVSGRSAVDVATMTTRSEQYRGLSVGEVECYQHLRRAVRTASIEQRLSTDISLLDANEPTVKEAKAALKAAGPSGSRKDRRADTREERLKERSKERKELAGPSSTSPSRDSTNVVPFQSNKDSTPSESATTQLTPMQARLAAVREKMKQESE